MNAHKNVHTVLVGKQIGNFCLRPVCATIFAAEKNVYYIFWACVCSFRQPACYAHALYCRMLPVRWYNISPYYLIHGKIFGKTKLLNVKCVLISSKTHIQNSSHFKTNTARYRKCA